MRTIKSLASVAAPILYKQKEKELIELADKYRGNFKLIADKAGLTVAQVQRFYKDYEPFQNAVNTAREAFYNSALARLEQLIEQGNMSAINLYFSRSPWARSNGWSEKVETEQKVTLTDAEKANRARELLGIE